MIGRDLCNNKKFLFKTFFVFIVALTLSPLVLPGIPQGMDWLYHVVRIESIKEGLVSGEFPVKIHSLPINGYGYGSGLFYPQIFLYIPALLRVIGVNIDIANKLFIFLIVCLKAVTSYYSAKYVSKNRYVSICITMMLMIFPLAVYKIYILLSYGDMIGAVFAPLVICGTYNLVYEDFDKPYLLGLGFLGLICSHIISTVMMGIAVVMMLLFNLKAVFGNREKVKKLVVTAACDLILTAFIWVPLLEQMLSSKFFVSEPWPDFVERSKLFHMCIVYLSPYLPVWVIIAMIITVVLLITFFGTVFIRKIKKVKIQSSEKKFVLDLVISCVILLIIMTDIFPWFLFEKIFGFMQFTSRLFYVVEVFLCFCIPIGLSLIFGDKLNKVKVFSWTFTLLLASDVVLLAYMFSKPQVVTDETISSLTAINDDTIKNDNGRIFTYDVGWGREYLPLDTDILLLNNQNTIISSDGSELSLEKRGSTVNFSPGERNQVEYFDVPRIFYKGYKAVGIDKENNRVNLRIEKGDNNIIRVFSEGKSYDKIEVSYKGTTLRRISEMTSLIFLLLSLAVYAVFRKKK